ncbi:MAG TPA: tetratricopeptide repeat protein [Pyrinomonadaceae bacterium]|nr:tetratricopeptide repeat protein [Pyrinomonadaceae bacterium]
MLSGFHSRISLYVSVFALALLLCAPVALAQDADELGEESADPVKLFNQGQNAHEKKDYELALEFYEQAIKLRPEFPEAEYQRARALVALNRLPEAEKAYRRAMELRAEWPLPPAALGVLLARERGRDREAETLLRRALELDAKNPLALAALADILTRGGRTAEALELWQRATVANDRDASLWLARGAAEEAAKDSAAALKSYERALTIAPGNVEARLRRAEIYTGTGDKERALGDVRALEVASKSDVKLAFSLAAIYVRLGLVDDARRIFESLPEDAKNSDEGKKLHLALNARCEDTPETRAALEKLIEREPRNAAALACLGGLYRTTEPGRALKYYEQAAGIEPRNVNYATGYASVLLQLRKFPEAATILQRILQIAPDNYAAHANFATALYELKLYNEAIVEYKWINRARPELAVVHYFIGSAHDYLGEYGDALAAYQTFLASADAQVNQLEIEKVNLRLPSLRNQIKRGEGARARKKVQ